MENQIFNKIFEKMIAQFKNINFKAGFLKKILILQLLSSCESQESVLLNNSLNNESLNIKNEAKKVEKANHLEKSKAFDDIFFGEDENSFKAHTKYYSIADISFFLDKDYPSFEIDNKLGLSEFTLYSGKRDDFNYCLKEIELISSIIEKKYSKATKLIAVPAPKEYGPVMKLEMKISSAKSFPPPDDGHLNFIYKWNKDSITIKAGIQTVYYERKVLKKINNVFEEVIEYEKNYIKVIWFSSDKLNERIAKNNKLTEEQNQKVRNEKLKKVIKKDIEKF
jgi:hypothetical protein